MAHTCGEKERLQRLERFLDGNGNIGLIKQVANVDTRVNSLLKSSKQVEKSMKEITEYINKQRTTRAAKKIVSEEHEKAEAAKRERRKTRWTYVKWVVYALISIGLGITGYIIG